MSEHYLRELRRFRFVVKRDGLPAARDFAEQTLESYIKAKKEPRHHANLRDYAFCFNESIRCLQHLAMA